MEKGICKEPSCYAFGRYCRLHGEGGLKKPSPINKESDTMKDNKREYAKSCAKYKKEHLECEAKLESICTGKTNDVHHKKGRCTKEELLNETYYLAVCRNCHTWIEQNPLQAMNKGLSVSRHAKTELVN